MSHQSLIYPLHAPYMFLKCHREAIETNPLKLWTQYLAKQIIVLLNSKAPETSNVTGVQQ